MALRIALRSRTAQGAAIAAALALASGYVALTARPLAAGAAGQGDRAALERAVALDPGNPEHHYRLGQYRVLVDLDPRGAVMQFEGALAGNPMRARYWLGLAGAFQMASDEEGQRRAIDGALAAEPRNPDVAWEGANLYLVRGHNERALELLARVVATGEARTQNALALAWRASGEIERLLAMLPQNPERHAELLSVLAQRGDNEAAEKTWAKLIALQRPVEFRRVAWYVDHLVASNHPERAAAAWRELAMIVPGLEQYVPGEERVVNGGFELSMRNAGFDWRFQPLEQVKAELDSSEFREGSRSLSITFAGDPTYSAGVSQYVVLQPNTGYELRASVRSENLVSASGPRLALVDTGNGAVLATTAETLGTQLWKQETIQFRSGPETRLAQLRIVRSASGTRIKGKYWMDSVSLRRERSR